MFDHYFGLELKASAPREALTVAVASAAALRAALTVAVATIREARASNLPDDLLWSAETNELLSIADELLEG